MPKRLALVAQLAAIVTLVGCAGPVCKAPTHKQGVAIVIDDHGNVYLGIGQRTHPALTLYGESPCREEADPEG